MKLTLSRAGLAIAAASALFIYGCGGSSGGSTTGTSSSLTGVAATGAALANANVAITNKAGNSPCTEATITTTALGGYTCTLKTGESAPFFIVVTDPTGNTPALVSIATETPAAGTPLTINATPLTTAIVAQLNGGDALGVVNDKSKYIAADFVAIKANVVAQLKDVLAALGVPDGYDPFTTKMTAATSSQAGDTADKVLDIVKITVDGNGKPALSVIGDDKLIAIATKDANTVVVVAKPADNISELSIAAQQAAKEFAACFALPVSQRVLSINNLTAVNGGPEVNDAAPVCQNLVTNGTTPAGAPKFLHAGYSAGQFYFYELNNDNMTGAVFSVPEIMAFYPAVANATNSSQFDRAVVNIRYLDKNGDPGNSITVAARIPGSATTAHPTPWWLIGNQQNVDVGIKTIIRRQVQLGANLANNGPVNRFQSGLNFYIGANGPNSDKCDSALVTGPGLPDSGIWWARKGSTDSFVLADQRLPAPLVYPTDFSDNCDFCSNYWMAKTVDSAGAGASQYAANPNWFNWTHGNKANANLKYKKSNGSQIATQDPTANIPANTPFPVENSYDGSDASKRPKKGDVYTVKLYKTTSGVPSLYQTITKTLLTDFVDPVNGVNMQWNTAGPQMLAALDPINTTLQGTQTQFNIDWVQNPGAEQVKFIAPSLQNGDANARSGVKKGATSTLAVAPNGLLYTALSGTYVGTGATQGGYREIYMTYRMLNGSQKQSVFNSYP